MSDDDETTATASGDYPDRGSPDDSSSGAPADGDPAGISYTEIVQTELILRSVTGVAAFPERWQRSPNGVEYLYRKGSVLVRDWRLDEVRAVLAELVAPGHLVPDQVVPGATRLSWVDTNRELSVERVLRALEERFGPGIATPDHLLYVCGHSCAAIEPEVVPPDAVPVPRPQIGQDAADPHCRSGQGFKVLIMDTGFIAKAALDHYWMTGVTGEADLLFNPSGWLAQDAGHGTFTAGCVRVTAPEASVHVTNATAMLPLEPDAGPIGAAFESDLAALVREQLVQRPGGPTISVPDILVLNFAGTSRNGGPLLAFNALYDDVIQHLKELLILSPAGNEGDTRKNWPGSFSWVVSVGGLAANWRDRASWSNYGHNVDVYAPGDQLVNAFATGKYVCTWKKTKTEKEREKRKFSGMARWSGTSFSTPLVAGMVAARMSTTGQNSHRAWHSLFDLAERQAVPGVGPVLYPGQGCCGSP